MYLRLYTMIEQILPQGITLWTQNWENMPYIYDTYTQEQADNVATLMFDLGMMLEADYVPTGTGAYLSDHISSDTEHLTTFNRIWKA